MDIPGFTEWVKDVERDDLTTNDFNPKVAWFDKGHDFARLTMLPVSNGDWVADLANPVAMLTAAQMNTGHIVVISDACRPLTKTKPDGTRWQPGDAAAALRLGLNDLVEESLLVTIVGADGTITDVSTTYHRHSGGPVTYDETDVNIYPFGDPRGEGRLVWLLRSAIQQPKAFPGLVKALGHNPLPEGQEDMYMLAAAVQVVMERTHWNCMIGAATEEEQSALRAALKNADNLVVLDKDQVNEISDLERMWENS